MVLKRYTTVLAVSAALTFIIPIGAEAASVTTSTTAVRIGDASFYKSETYSDSMRFAHALSSHYDRPILTSEVVRLKANFDFGFGDISMMYAVAEYAGLPIDDIVVLRKKNMGWGEIAKLHGLKVQELKHRHNLFVDDAHARGIDIHYIDFDEHDSHRDNYHEHDRDKDRNHDERYEHGRNQDSNHDERYEQKPNQNSNKDQHQDKNDKKNNKKVYDHNNDKGNGHK